MVVTSEKSSGTIHFNITQLHKIEAKTHPHLYKLLGQRYSGISRGERLEQFLKAMKLFQPDEPGNYTDRDGRKWIPVPRDNALIKQNGGGAGSWGNNLRAFCVLGLATPYNPDNHGKQNLRQVQHFAAAYEARKKTESMNAYYKAHRDEYPHKHTSHSPTFYNVQRYGKKCLAEAERRAAILSRVTVGYWRKDLIRDALGGDIANQAFDTMLPMGQYTADQRERLKMAALKRYSKYGYFYPAEVLTDALSASDALTAIEAEAIDIFDAYDEPIDLAAYREEKQNERHYRQTWDSYFRYALLEEMGWKLGPPTRADREAYHLSNGEYIVTRRQ